MYITGDTLVIDELHEIRRRHPHIDLALLHLGGTMVLGILVTMDAKQGVEALQIVQPDLAIPIHFNDYDVFKSPLSEFQHAVAEAGLANKVRYLSHGDTYTFSV
jgi:L-ascorbate metabolism protein UlaG (beta-lactamase superfamily)